MTDLNSKLKIESKLPKEKAPLYNASRNCLCRNFVPSNRSHTNSLSFYRCSSHKADGQSYHCNKLM